MRRCTVLIADDHAIVKEALVALLSDHDFEVVGAVGDGDELIEAARRLRPDVILTDLTMPGQSGREVLTKLKAERIDSKVIVLTMHNVAELATQALRTGARGFLLKRSAGSELLTAIREAMRHRSYVTPLVTEGMLGSLMQPAGEAPARQLTPRQREVLQLLAEGKSMKEVASILSVSARTVAFHKYRMM